MKPGDLRDGLYAPRRTWLREESVPGFVAWAVTQHGWTRVDVDGGPGHIFLRKENTTYSYQVMAEGDVWVCIGTSHAAAPFVQRYCVEMGFRTE